MKGKYKLPPLPKGIKGGLIGEIEGVRGQAYRNGVMNTLLLIGNNIDDETFESVLIDLLPEFNISIGHSKMLSDRGGSPISERLYECRAKQQVEESSHE